MPFLSPVNDNCPSWISGRVRMVVEFFSCPSLNERMWPDRGSNQRPLDSQSDSAARPYREGVIKSGRLLYTFAATCLMNQRFDCLSARPQKSCLTKYLNKCVIWNVSVDVCIRQFSQTFFQIKIGPLRNFRKCHNHRSYRIKMWNRKTLIEGQLSVTAEIMGTKHW